MVDESLAIDPYLAVSFNASDDEIRASLACSSSGEPFVNAARFSRLPPPDAAPAHALADPAPPRACDTTRPVRDCRRLYESAAAAS